MCMKIHANGHLCIKLLYEQNLPQIDGDTIKFRECYDIIFRNFSKHPMTCLDVLTPHLGFKNASSKPLIKYPECEFFDWIFLQKTQGADGIIHLEFPSTLSGGLPLGYDVTWLDPVIRDPECFAKSPNTKAIFTGTDMTLVQLRFRKDRVIETYDPNREAETTYWLRLCYEPEMNQYVASPLQFGKGSKNIFRIQPCIGLGPQAILDSLDIKLNALKTSKKFESFIPGARSDLWENLFTKDNTSTIIQDYRINVITTEKFIFLNPHVDGPCGYVGLDPIPNTNTIARTWLAGSNNYLETSPLEIARQISSYIFEWAYNKEDAKSKEHIASAISSEIYSNACHVTEALSQEGIIRESDKAGFYYAVEHIDFARILSDPDTLDKSFADYEQIRDRYLSLLNRFSSCLSVSKKPTKLSVFKPKDFRIQYELVYV